MSWSSLRESGCIQGDLLTICRLEEVRISCCSRTHKIDFQPEQLLKVLLQSEPLVGDGGAIVIHKLDEEVQITGRIELPRCGRSEEFQALDGVLAAQCINLGAMFLN